MTTGNYVPRLLPHHHLPKVCVAVTGTDPVDMMAKAEARLGREPDLALPHGGVRRV